MRLIREFWKEHRRKLKVSALLGFSTGLVVVAILLAHDSAARGRDVGDADPRPAGETAPSWLAGAADLVAKLTPPAAEPPETLPEPKQLMDKSIERLGEAMHQDPPSATLTLEDGQRIEFTVEPEVQLAVEALLAKSDPVEAAVVALNPRTGEVLALAGWKDHALAPHQALAADAPAASIFKIVTATALIEEHGIHADKVVAFHGGGNGFGLRLLTPDPERDVVEQTMGQGMARSTNLVFGRLADQNLAHAELQQTAERFGFNQTIPFTWPVEISRADVPDDRLEFARMAAGFRHATLSPLHGAMLAAAIGNDGTMMQPTVIRRIHGPDGTVLFESRPAVFSRVLGRAAAREIGGMMLATTTEGTAARYFSKRSKHFQGIDVAGKTGSLSEKHGDEQLFYYWFVGYAPLDDPQIAVAAVGVNGARWKLKGTLLARTAMDAWFSKGKEPQRHKRGTRK